MKDIRTLFSMIGKLFYILNKKQKRTCIVLFFMILFSSLFELLGVTAILPFIQAVLAPEELVSKRYIKDVISFLHIETSVGLISFIGCIIIVVYFLKNGFLSFAYYFQTRFRCKLQKDLSIRMLESFLKRPYSYFLDVNSSIILRGINGDVDSISYILDSIFKFLVEFISCLFIGVFIFVTDSVMATGVLLIAGASFVIVTLSFKKRVSESGIKQRDASAEKSKYAYQSIMGIKEIKVMQRSNYFVNAYHTASETAMRTTVNYEMIKYLPERIIEAVCIGGIIAVVCFRLQMKINPLTFVPQLGTFAIAAFRILPSVARMTGDITNLVFFRTSLEEMYGNLMDSQKYEEYVEEYRKTHEKCTEDDALSDISFADILTIKNICWKYPNSTKMILSDLSLSIHKGEAIAFIGTSGAGKTTLADVMLGLLRPLKGNIFMDDVDIFTIPKEWSKIIGYVPQTVFLIDDTIRNNITFGIYDENMDDQAVWDALEQAQLKSFVMNLENGLDTFVGERGVKFSGGQRQRMAIARALYCNPDILVLDEATASLDTETETAVMESIDALQGHKTLIIVAHRLTTIRNCNRIIEIVNGKAKERIKEEVLR